MSAVRQHAGQHGVERNSHLNAVVDKPFGARHVAPREAMTRIVSLAGLSSVQVKSLFADEYHLVSDLKQCANERLKTQNMDFWRINASDFRCGSVF